jgi:hypothetical protein
MKIAAEFQQRCEEFPQNTANLQELEIAMVEEIFDACTEFHMVDDDKTLHAFAFKDVSAMTVVNRKGQRFEILNAKELKAIRKARHLTMKGMQDLALALEAEQEGCGPVNDPAPEARGTEGQFANEPELEDI